MKKIMFMVDVENWAYDYRAKRWKDLLKDEYEIDILYLSTYPLGNFRPNYMMSNRYFLSILNNSDDSINLNSVVKEDLYYYTDAGRNSRKLEQVFDHTKYDGFLFFYSKALSDKRLLSTYIPFKNTAICINNEKWTEFGSNVLYNNYLQGVKVIACCNDNIIEEFSKYSKNIMKLSQCAPDDFVLSKNEIESRHKNRYSKKVVGFSGNSKNKLKNYTNIMNACKSLRIEFSSAKELPQNNLKEWYKKIDLLVCASTSEGGPMCILEAGACGVPVLTTRVGLSREIINEDTGYFLDGKSQSSIEKGIVETFKDRDKMIQKALNLNKEIKNNWTYSSRIHEIKSVLKNICK